MKPDFFIVGGPKCGTTALWTYLRFHPEIYLPDIKEPHFFSKDLGRFCKITELEAYEMLFDEASGYKTSGEASVLYAFSEVALKNIFAYNPNAKIIMIIRNPIEVAHSFHSELKYNFNENEESFEKAWELQEERKNGISVPKKCSCKKLLQYKEIALFGKQMERVLAVFPSKNIHFVLFDDFKKQTSNEYNKLLEFLGVSKIKMSNFPIINENKKYRSKLVGEFVNKPPRFIYRYTPLVKRILGVKNIRFLKFLESRNRIPVKRKHLPSSFRKILVKEFRNDIEIIGKILDRDLNHWM